jgi:DNA-binding response OmpR family regulator
VADNREDRSGAHFAFTIPREIGDLEESDSAGNTGLSVLVVTDDAALGARSRELLAAAGCRVDVTGDGCEAGDRLVEIGADLVLLDAEMSTPGGIETIELMRRLPDARGRVPIVVVSHDDDDRHQTRLREAGANSWLVKPLAQRDVASLLARWGAAERDAPRPARKER